MINEFKIVLDRKRTILNSIFETQNTNDCKIIAFVPQKINTIVFWSHIRNI